MSTHLTDRRTFLASSLAASTAIAAGGSLHRLAFAAPAKKKWESLFDGKTLEGWHKNPERIGHGTAHQLMHFGQVSGHQPPRQGLVGRRAGTGKMETHLDEQHARREHPELF